MNILSRVCLALLLILPCDAFAAKAEKLPYSTPPVMVGEFSVLPLLDGPNAIPLSFFRGASEDEMLKIAGTGNVPGAFNVFAVKKGRETYLVDTGAGKWMGDKGGRLLVCLEAVRITPVSVSKIFMTHLHGDHAGGLIKGGHPFFVNAQVYVAKPEYAYWTSEETMKNAPEAMRVQITRVRDALKILEKAGKLQFFNPGDQLAPGVTSVDLAGHTPGHAGFLLTSQGKKIFFVGDIVHSAILQMRRPDITIVYDVDQAKAKEVRLATLKKAAEDKIPIAGGHLPFPGIGTVTADGQGYTFELIK